MDSFIFDIEKALFYNEFDKVKALFESEQFSPDLLVDCGSCKDINVPTPIYYISQLWNEILPGEWPLCQEAVDKHLEELYKITDYLEKVFQVPVKEPIDLSKYIKYITYYDCKTSQEDIMDITREELKARGHRDIDIDLYCATSRFDFVETERLLKLGAVDSVCFDEMDKEYTTYHNMSDDFLERDDWQTHTLYPNPDYQARKYDRLFVKSMFGSAAKYRMLKLLNKYYEINHPKQ